MIFRKIIQSTVIVAICLHPITSRAKAATLSHVPMVGASTDTAVSIWVRADAAASVIVQYQIAGGNWLQALNSAAVNLTAENDFTAAVSLTNLSAASSYDYRVILDGVIQTNSASVFKTLPATGAGSQFSFVFGADIQQDKMPHSVFGNLAAQQPDFAVILGNTIHSDLSSPAQTEADFWNGYKLNRGDAFFQSFANHTPIFTIWGDHDYGTDNSDSSYPLKNLSRAAFGKYWANPPYVEQNASIYYKFSVANTDFFMLDTRWNRVPGGTLLGAAQLQWLKDQLLTSRAKFKFIVSPVMVSDFGTSGADSWSGFSAERSDIFEFITQNNIKNTIFLSGDQGWAGAFLINHPVFQIGHGVQGFYELSTAPLSASRRVAPYQNDPQVLFEADQDSYYGLARVDTTVVPSRAQFEIRRGSDDAVVYSSTVEEFTPTPPPTIVTSSLAQGTVNTAYSQILTATDGVPPYRWSVSNGALPTGLSLSSTGIISGTPTEAAAFSFTAVVQDTALATDSRTLSLVVNPALLTASPTIVTPGGTVTASWNGITNPTAKDWMGLYAVGAGNGSYQYWIYVSCTRVPGNAQASGSCLFPVPSTLPNGTYELRLFANDGFTRLATSNPFTVSTLPVVTLASTGAKAAEGGAPGQFTVMRTGSAANALKVFYAVGGTATNGTDYTALSGSVVIPANSSSAAIDIAPVDDSIVEGSETVVLTLSANVSYTIGDPSVAMITMSDNDFVPTVVVTGGAFTFDGNPHGATGFAYGVGGVSDVLNPPVTISYHGTGGTNYGPTSIAPTNVGTYTATASFAGNANYQSASSSATITINPVTATLTLSNLSQTFDGTPRPVTVTTNPPGLAVVAVTYNGSATAPTNAGSYVVVATLTNPNFVAGNATGTLVIGKAASAVSVTGGTFSFDGNPHGATGFAYGIDGVSDFLSPPVTISYHGTGGTNYGPTPTAPTNVGTYTATANFPGNGNYNGASNAASITINAATATLTLSNLNQTFDGTPRPATATTNPPGLAVTTLTYNGSATAPTNAGSYAVVASLTNANYTAPDATGTLVINKANSGTTLTVADATYDGSPHGGTANVTGVGGLNQPLAVTYTGTGGTPYPSSSTAPTNAGTYSASASFAGDENHNGSSDTKTFTVNKAGATLSFASLAHTYDGTAKTATAATNPAGLAAVAITYNGSAIAPTNAGSYAVVASLSNANYAAPDVTDTLTINKATAALGLSNLVQTFNNTPRSPTVTTTPAGLTGVTITYNASATTPTKAGSYAVVASLANSNYSAPDVTGTLTISKATPIVSVTGGTFTFDSNPHGATGFAYGVGGVSDVLSPAVTFSYQGTGATTYGPTTTPPTSAGTYTVTASFAGNSDYNSVADTATVTIDATLGPSLAVNPAVVTPGSGVTASWTGIVNPTTKDWIGLYTPGAADGSYQNWIYVSCTRTPGTGSASGSCPLSVPSTSGIYELRLFANDGFNRLAISNQFTIGSLPVVTIAATDNRATEGNPADTGGFTVSRTGSTTSALTVNYTVGGAASNGVDYQTLSGSVVIAAGQVSAPITVTTIDDNLVEGNETVVVTQSPNAAYTAGSPSSGMVTITDNDTPPGPVLGASPTSIPPGSAVTATWGGIASPTSKDWIGLYANGAGDGSYQTWIYVSCTRAPGIAQASGSCPLSIPSSLQTGTYELRLFANDGFTRLATSNTFAVTLSTSNIAISWPPRNVSVAPNMSTVSIARDECNTIFSVPYIQTSNMLTVSAAAVSGSVPSGGGVKFVLNENLPGQMVQYDMSAPFSATFTGVAKGEYRLDVYIIDSSQNIVPGESNHDYATNIGIGDIYVAIGDSITEGYDGTGYTVPPYTNWLQAPITSRDNRNYPQCGIGSGFTRDHWQEASHHIALNDELQSYFGYPVFILNEGVAGITTSGYVTRMGTTSWQRRITTLGPNKWLIDLGTNDLAGSPAFQSSMQTIVSMLMSTYGASGSDIVLSIPPNGPNWQPYIDNLISENALWSGPDFNTFYLNNTNPQLMVGLHPNVAGHLQMARLWTLSIMSPKNVAAQQINSQVRVSWDDLRSIEPTIAGYKVYYGTNVTSLTNAIDVGYATSAFIAIPSTTEAQTYYFSVQAYDDDLYRPNVTASSNPVGVTVQ